MKRFALPSVAAAVLAISGAAHASSSGAATQAITEDQVVAAQQAWCNALISISQANAQNGQAAAKALAEQVIDGAYAYQMGPVLFKPTLTVAPQTFRTTREGALAYFVGGNSDFPKDDGFALKGWTACNAEKAAVFIAGHAASWMGNIMLTGADGNVTTVDKTWKFVKDDQGQLRIAVHHSSLPFSGS